MQGIPAALDRPAPVTYSGRISTQFNATDTAAMDPPITTPATLVTETNAAYEEYVLPDEYSIFLIRLGSESDDLATRYNTLLLYTKGLLKTIEHVNQVTVLPAKP